MPGCFGIVTKKRLSENKIKGTIAAMANSLMHQRNYSLDTFVKEKIGLGKIEINSNVGEKIYVSPSDPKLACMIFGEIYKYYEDINKAFKNQKESQSENIVNIYKEHGIETPKMLNGKFNVLLIDQKNGDFHIFNDRFGFNHIYYYEDENLFAFAPEIKALLIIPHVKTTMDEHGVADYFNYSYHFGDRTMFEEIKLMPPASIITSKNNIIRIDTYWRPEYKEERGVKDLEDCIETGYNLFTQSVKRCVEKCKTALIPISGGLDSRIILSTSNKMNIDITPFSFGISGCLDHRIAKEICTILKLKRPPLVIQNSDIILKYAESLFMLNEANYSGLGLTTQYACKDVMGLEYDCFLNGIFGGHLSFGSPYYNQSDLGQTYTDNERINRLIKGLNGHRYDTFLRECATKTLNNIAEKYREKTITEEWERTKNVSESFIYRKDAFFLYNRIRRAMNSIDQNRYFYNDQLPFASYELYDFYLTLKSELTMNHFLYKEIYKKKLPHLSKIPWQSTGVNLYETPSSLKKIYKKAKKNLEWYSSRLTKGKINYIDRDKDAHHDINYRNDRTIRDWIWGILMSEQCLDRGLYNRDGLKNLLDWELRGGSAFPEISKMVIFEMWARKYVDKT